MFRTSTHRRTQTGFSIVELMVGTVVAMLAILVIFNAFAMFEGQKRSTTSTNDVQATGMQALQAIEHDVRMAGYGLTVNILGANYLACSTINAYRSGAATTIPAVPISITDGGADSDTITVMYSTSPFASTPAMLGGGILNSSSNVVVSNTANDPLCPRAVSDPIKCVFNPGDYVLLAQPTLGKNCSQLRVTGTTNLGATLTIQHATTDPANPPGATNIFPTTTTPTGYDDSATDPTAVINMGAMVRARYTVSNNSLTYQDLTGVGAGAVNLASGVVLMKAQYGIATTGTADQSVDSWIAATSCTSPTAATPGWSTTRDPINTTLCFPVAANVSFVKAIRIAVVVRSSLLEKDNVTFVKACPSGISNNGPCAWSDTAANPAPVINLSADPNWQRYRYRVFETIIPLRNVLWANL